MRLKSWIVGAVLLAGVGASHAEAQLEVTGRGASIRIGGRLHTQYAASSVEDANGSVFLRRARLIADITVNDLVSGRIQPDFAGGTATLQDAYVELSFSDRFVLSLGQFKRPFDLFELSSSVDLSLIERDGRVGGVSGCAGVGSVCTYSRLTQRLEFAGRDQGVRVTGEDGPLGWQFSLTNGTGLNAADENDQKSASGRVTFASGPQLRVSGEAAVHDYLDSDDETARALAWGADVEFGTWRDGFLLQGSFVGGENWRLRDALDEPAGFLAFQGAGSWYAPRDGRLSGVEALLRLGWADPDTDGVDDAALLVTPGFMFYVGGRNKLGVNLDVYSPQEGDTEYSLKFQSFLYY